MTAIRSVLLAGLVSGMLCGQTAPAAPRFEVASIRPSAPLPLTKFSMGVHIDGAQARFEYFSLKDYVRIAYRLKHFQVETPEWMASQRFDITAKLPDGTGRDQVPEMLQTLLTERLGVKFHRETKEFPVFALLVGKGGPLIKESPPDPAAEASDPGQMPISVAAVAGPQGSTITFEPGSYFQFGDDRFEAKKLTMERFAEMLSRFTERPVVNMTDLKGRYDFTLEVTHEQYRGMLIRAAIAAGVNLPPEALRLLDSESDNSLATALQALGFKLESRKAPLDLLVVDHAEKEATEN